ncbi:MAG: hypothetical protein K9N10_22665 [Deltaproteobacteria bacterium]|jgi:hypothetical protein|nr:hypothetical protein [Deltaproteobacteria bacterium]
MKQIKHRIKKIENALLAAYHRQPDIVPPKDWADSIMTQVYAQTMSYHNQKLAFLANLRVVWRFSAVTCTLAMALSFYAFGHISPLDPLTILFLSEDPTPLMVMELLVL